MKIIDSHTHPQFSEYENDREETIKRAIEGGVGMICVGTDLTTSQKAVELAEKYDGMWASVGVHPSDSFAEEFDQGSIINMAENAKVIAIGEVGLDFYRAPDLDLQQMQKERFETQLKMAVDMRKPLIIHCRNAHDQMLSILMQNQDARGVIHSFTGTSAEAQRYFDLGFYIGLNGIITFARQYDEVVLNAPLNRVLLETDAPYLAPIPYRGKRNESLYIIEVAKKIAELRGISVEDVIKATSENAAYLFQINLNGQI